MKREEAGGGPSFSMGATFRHTAAAAATSTEAFEVKKGQREWTKVTGDHDFCWQGKNDKALFWPSSCRHRQASKAKQGELKNSGVVKAIIHLWPRWTWNLDEIDTHNALEEPKLEWRSSNFSSSSRGHHHHYLLHLLASPSHHHHHHYGFHFWGHAAADARLCQNWTVHGCLGKLSRYLPK